MRKGWATSLEPKLAFAPRHGLPWTEEEEADLREAAQGGATIERLMELHGRVLKIEKAKSCAARVHPRNIVMALLLDLESGMTSFVVSIFRLAGFEQINMAILFTLKPVIQILQNTQFRVNLEKRND